MDPSFKLFKAARLGHIKDVKKFLENGADPSGYCNGKGSTSLMSAVQYNNIDIVMLLLEVGADVHAASATGRTALMTAAFHSRPECARLLLQYGAKTRDLNKRGWSALMFGAAAGAHEVVQILVDSGEESIDRKDKKGNTALMLATVNGHDRAIEVLVKAGADPNTKNKEGNTPWLVGTANKSSKILSNLIRAGGERINYDLNTNDAMRFAMGIYQREMQDQFEGFIMDKTAPGFTFYEPKKKKKKKKIKDGGEDGSGIPGIAGRPKTPALNIPDDSYPLIKPEFIEMVRSEE